MPCLTAPSSLLRPYAERDYEPVLQLCQRVYGREHSAVEDWRFCRFPQISEPRHVVEDSGSPGLAGFGGLRAQPWMYQVRRRALQLVVAPEAQGRGIGARLFELLLEEAQGMELACLEASVLQTRPGAVEFLRRRGFAEQDCHWTLILDVSRAPLHRLPDHELSLHFRGIRIVTLAELRAADPECLAKLHALWVAVSADQPHYDPATAPSREQFIAWMESPTRDLEGTFVAVHGKEYVGTSMTQRRGPDGTLFQNITGVSRDYRRRGIATGLKLRVLDYARCRGHHSVLTYNDSPNQAMLALNEKLGFVRVFGKTRMQRML